jgi:hypothetical protein
MIDMIASIHGDVIRLGALGPVRRRENEVRHTGIKKRGAPVPGLPRSISEVFSNSAA